MYRPLFTYNILSLALSLCLCNTAHAVDLYWMHLASHQTWHLTISRPEVPQFGDGQAHFLLQGGDVLVLSIATFLLDDIRVTVL